MSGQARRLKTCVCMSDSEIQVGGSASDSQPSEAVYAASDDVIVGGFEDNANEQVEKVRFEGFALVIYQYTIVERCKGVRTTH